MAIPAREFWRKSVHFSGIFFIPVLLWNRNVFAGLLIAFLICYLAVELLDRRGIAVPLLTALTKNSKRDFEKGRLSKGALFLVFSGICLPYLVGPQAAAVGLAQIFTADAASTWAGMKWGRRKLPYAPGKSWVGSTAFFLTALIVSLLFTPWPLALLLALVGTLVESIPLREADNLTVPWAVSLVAHFASLS